MGKYLQDEAPRKSSKAYSSRPGPISREVGSPKQELVDEVLRAVSRRINHFGTGGGGVNALAADKVLIADVLNNYAAPDVEAALAEIYADLTSTSGSIFSNLASSSGSSLVGFLQSGTGAVATTLQENSRQWLSITQFMTNAQRADAQLATPVLDHASAMSAAIVKLMGAQGAITARGGEIYIPPGYRIRLATDPFGVLPNDGGAPPTQTPIRIFGAVSDAQATGSIDFKGASIIDFRYTTANNAKIDSRGRGLLEIDHLVIADESGNSEPFIFTSNTVVLIHDNLFIGSKTAAWDQDCILLGSTSTTIDGTSDAPFQGYGSQIYNNHFHKIRRAVYGRVFANGVPIHHNTVWQECGFATGAPFDFDGDPLNVTVEVIAGMPVHHNLIEMVNYKYGIKCREAATSTLGPNDFYDPGASVTSYYTFGDGALYNMVLGGFHDDTETFVEETGTAVGTNSWITAHQSQESRLLQNLTLGGTQTSRLKALNTATTPVYLWAGEDSGGHVVDAYYNGTLKEWVIEHTPSGGAAQLLLSVKDFGAGTVILTLRGTDTRIRSEASLIQIDSASQINETMTFQNDCFLKLPVMSDATRGAAGTTGRVIFNSTDGNLNIDNGANWILPDGTVT